MVPSELIVIGHPAHYHKVKLYIFLQYIILQYTVYIAIS